VRAGAGGHRGRRPGPRPGHRQRLALRARRRGVDRRPGDRALDGPGAAGGHRVGEHLRRHRRQPALRRVRGLGARSRQVAARPPRLHPPEDDVDRARPAGGRRGRRPGEDAVSAGPVVGFVGLGRMGAPMAANVARAGFPLVVHDRRPEAAEPLVAAGARWAADAAGCAAAADVLVTMLPTPADVREVLLGTAGAGGAAGALRPGSTWIDMSTSTPEVAAEVRRVVEPRGVAVLDAPVAGMVAGARAGTLGIYVGGDAETLAACRPVLEAMGDPERILHIGPHGTGYVAKLCINLLWFMHEVAAAEVLSIGVRAGARLEALQRAIVASPATSQVVAQDLDRVW